MALSRSRGLAGWLPRLLRRSVQRMKRPYHAEAFSPDAVIGKIDGIAIVIEAAVLGRSGVIVALTAKRSATTGELQAGWQQNSRGGSTTAALRARTVMSRRHRRRSPALPCTATSRLCSATTSTRRIAGSEPRWADLAASGRRCGASSPPCPLRRERSPSRSTATRTAAARTCSASPRCGKDATYYSYTRAAAAAPPARVLSSRALMKSALRPARLCGLEAAFQA